MWVYLALASAILLGAYDVSKKVTLRKNGVLWSLFAVCALSTAMLGPFFKAGSLANTLLLVPKSVLVALSWIACQEAIKCLPMTTVSTIKAVRPVLVVIFSVVIFSERLSAGQWCGVVLSLLALWLLSFMSRKEGIAFTRDKGILWMLVSVISGTASAIYDKYVVVKLNDPLFVQSWSQLFITVLVGLVLFVQYRTDRKNCGEFKWDWYLVLTAFLIVAADALYFFSLSCEGAMLAVISLVRRSSMVISFSLGAFIFKESNVRGKLFPMALMLAAITMLVIFSTH